MRTQIERDAAGGFVDGFKRYISNAGVADVYVVNGVTDQSMPHSRACQRW